LFSALNYKDHADEEENIILVSKLLGEENVERINLGEF
jgi:hypothetical protein